MTETTRRATELQITNFGVMLPMSMAPVILSKNGRGHWAERHRAFQAQKEFVVRIWQSEVDPDDRERQQPWESAVMDVRWHYWHPRHKPDDDNVWQRVSATRDAFQDIGLVTDDTCIRTGQVCFAKVAKDQACVLVSLRLEEPGV